MTSQEAPFESKFAGLALGKLLWVALLGCAVGFVMGVIASWFTKYTKELAVVEPLIVGWYLSPVFSFHVPNAFHGPRRFFSAFHECVFACLCECMHACMPLLGDVRLRLSGSVFL